MKSFLRENKLLTFILAGGKGRRLYPLTKDRAKPAVPFGGIYRIIDFTLSNCLNSGIHKIIVLTQYKSISLARHLLRGWSFLRNELDEFLEIIPPQQRTSSTWYKGTADAIYQNIYTIEHEKPDFVLILSGDHIYKMDYRKLLEFHIKNKADLTISAIETDISQADKLGVINTDDNNRVLKFQEKPGNPNPIQNNPHKILASMGIYVFSTKIMVKAISADVKKSSSHDFGKDIIPFLLKNKSKVYAYPFSGENKTFWQDVGSIDSYYEANMNLVQVDPSFNLYDSDWPVRTFMEQTPPVKTVFAQQRKGGRLGIALDSIVSGGSIISGGRVQRSVLSRHVRVNSYSDVQESILMEKVNIGRNAKIKRAIIDKEVSIPEGMQIGYNSQEDRKRFFVTQSGIVVIPKKVKMSLQ